MEEKKNIFLKVLEPFTYKKKNEPDKFYIPKPEELTDKEYEENSPKTLNTKSNSISTNIQINIDFINKSFNAPKNKDIVIRKFVIAGQYRAFIAYLDGMIDKKIINDFILRPILNTQKLYGLSNICELDIIIPEVIEANQIKKINDTNEILYEILSGSTALYVDGCNYFVSVETKGFDRRSVDTTQIESAVIGSQEAFNETLRTNVTLIRKNIKNKNLIAEFTKVGEITQTTCAIVYMKGIVNPAIVDEVKRRMSSIKTDYIGGGGMLEQFIEDNPFSMFPTVLTTERPDKTVSHILEGKVAIFVDGYPFAEIVPVTFEAFMHAPDDNFMRWQYGTFMRFIRFSALVIAIMLPGFYVAITSFHQEMIPTELLIAIAKAKEGVPFPTILEVVLMELSFELIREAGIRIPGMIGNTLGIIGALILGQAAVQANIVSPILIIVVAVTGLSNFAIPNYAFAFSIRIIRFAFIFSGTVLGFYGLTIAWFILTCFIVSMKSFGVDYFAPFAPRTKRSMDFLTVHPAWRQERRPDYLNTMNERRQPKRSETWNDNYPKYSYERKNKK